MNFAIIGAVCSAIVAGIFALGYKKASPDEAYVVSGVKPEPRVATGRAAYCIPFLEQVDRITLSIIKIDIKTQEAVPTKDYINISVDAVATIRLMHEGEGLDLAIRNFLNKDSDYIREMVNDVLEGNIREIVGGMTLTDMVQERKTFSDKVQLNAVPDMESMGISIVSFNVQNFTDENNIIVDLGMENISRISKEASMVKADAEKEVAINQSAATLASTEAQIEADTEIAKRENDLEIKRHELKQEADKKRALADMAYEIEKEAQRKLLETTTAAAELEKTTKQIEIAQKAADVERQALQASIVAKAEADKEAQQQQAEAEAFARTKEAEASLVEAMKEAEAEKHRAEGILAVATAEAEGIKLKGLAEAEAVEKKAEAMKAMGEAAILEMYFNSLPEVAKSLAEPLSNIDSITMYGSGNTAALTEDITKSATQIMSGINDSLGVDIKSVLMGFLGGKLSSGVDETPIPQTAIPAEDLME